LDMNQHAHQCTFCLRVYGCGQDHHPPLGVVRAGGRCCAECRTANLAALDRLEKARRGALYV